MSELPTAPDVTPSPSQWSDRHKAATRNRFLDVHAELISPWRFPLPVRVQMAMGRLVAGWRECAEKQT